VLVGSVWVSAGVAATLRSLLQKSLLLRDVLELDTVPVATCAGLPCWTCGRPQGNKIIVRTGAIPSMITAKFSRQPKDQRTLEATVNLTCMNSCGTSVGAQT
jgi:hypothetical protein